MADPNITQEFLTFEFQAYGTLSLNQNWWVSGDLSAYRSFPLNPSITSRKFYSYIYGNVATNNPWGVVQATLRFHLRGVRVFSLPLFFFDRDPAANPLLSIATASQVNGLVSGGIVTPECLMFVPGNAMTDLSRNPEGADPVPLQPRYVNFEADRVDLDLTDATNGCDKNNMRIFVVIASQ